MVRSSSLSLWRQTPSRVPSTQYRASTPRPRSSSAPQMRSPQARSPLATKFQNSGSARLWPLAGSPSSIGPLRPRSIGSLPPAGRTPLGPWPRTNNCRARPSPAMSDAIFFSGRGKTLDASCCSLEPGIAQAWPQCHQHTSSLHEELTLPSLKPGDAQATPSLTAHVDTCRPARPEPQGEASSRGFVEATVDVALLTQPKETDKAGAIHPPPQGGPAGPER